MTSVNDPKASVLDTAIRIWRHRFVRIGLTLVAIGYLVLRWYLLPTSNDPLLAADAYTYWSAPYDDPYPGPQLGLPGAYLYSPAFIQVLAPLRLLPWEAFHAVWAAIGFGALVFLVGPFGGALVVTFLPFVYRDLLVGNIHLLLAATIVVGMRHSAVWALPLLTKITPGVGLLWFVSRREWRSFSVAVATTAAISVVSFALAPHLWFEWFARLRADTQTAGDLYVSLIGVRLAVAAVLVVYAGRADRPWLVPIGIVIALPILWPDSLAILLACFPLLTLRRRQRGRRSPNKR